jgi:pSer/pThr/pTyr-binding forkhead associated (FHA) protein
MENLPPGREFEIPSGGIVLGRYKSADVRVYSAYVKGAHVRLWPVKDGIGAEDLASTNGTAVNGTVFSRQPGSRQVVLRVGDRLTLASTHDFEIVERDGRPDGANLPLVLP